MAHEKLKAGALLIKGGHLIDPAAKIDGPMDILLHVGRVVDVAPPN
jgi:predicted amidohydrolase